MPKKEKKRGKKKWWGRTNLLAGRGDEDVVVELGEADHHRLDPVLRATR
jgi:hypothetical protein